MKLKIAGIIALVSMFLAVQPAAANHHFGGCPMGQNAHVGGWITSDAWVAYSVWYEHGYEQIWDYFQTIPDQYITPFGSTLGVPWNATIVNADVFTNGPHGAGMSCG